MEGLPSTPGSHLYEPAFSLAIIVLAANAKRRIIAVGLQLQYLKKIL